MSDFGELCPLFTTGVFNEITFPNIDLRNITVSGNALYGSLASSITMAGYFTFGRTVVVTGAFARRFDTSSQTISVNLYLKHLTSATAAGTVFGSCTIVSVTANLDAYGWMPFTVTEKTFTSSEILGLAPSIGAVSGVGSYNLIVRYKEK